MNLLLHVLVLCVLASVVTGLRVHNPILRSMSRVRSSTALALTTADFKNGMTLEFDGAPWKLLEFLHVKPGKGSAFVRSKLKNLSSGSTQEKTFRAGESVVSADVYKSEHQFTYKDGENFMFMNMETFEEIPVGPNNIDNADLLKEGLSCQVSVWNDQVIDVSLPQQVEYEVVETPPNFKGNTAQGGTKPATLDSGAVINVPMFIETGEKIIVSTQGRPEYMSRASGQSKNFNS
jgi:elongation factor P